MSLRRLARRIHEITAVRNCDPTPPTTAEIGEGIIPLACGDCGWTADLHDDSHSFRRPDDHTRRLAADAVLSAKLLDRFAELADAFDSDAESLRRVGHEDYANGLHNAAERVRRVVE